MTDGAHLIVFDTEFTAWEGSLARSWSGESEFREIVQIGALKLRWPSLEIVDSFSLLTKPVRNPQLSDYFIKLTGITQESIDRDGISFAEGLDRFHAFCGGALAASYGNDLLFMAETAQLQNIRASYFGGWPFVNLLYYIRLFDPTTAGVNSGRLWQHFGGRQPQEGAEHDALFDCHSIREALLIMRDKGAKLPL